MIVGAAVCPGAPFLIEGTADAIAARLAAVVEACSVAVARLTGADALMLITSAGVLSDHSASPAWRELAPGTVIATTPLRRSDLPDSSPVALATGAAAGPQLATEPNPAATPSVGTMVGAALLVARRSRTNGRGAPSSPPTTAIEITGDPADVAAMLIDRVDSAERIALLVIADGSACHGDDAPGRRDDRAAVFDAALAEALASGDPAALRRVATDRILGRELLASVEPLTVLALLTEKRPPTAADLLYAAAPLGVGYLVASWSWDNE